MHGQRIFILPNMGITEHFIINKVIISISVETHLPNPFSIVINAVTLVPVERMSRIFVLKVELILMSLE